MSDGFHELATPAPNVEAAVADKLSLRDEDEYEVSKIEAAVPSEDVRVEPAKQVGPAVTVDDPKQFAPKSTVMTKEEISHLSVAALRQYGSDFESKAGVICGRVEKNILKKLLPFIYDERDFVTMGEVLRFVFVKSNCIIVYGQETDPSPLYTIPLDNLRAIQEDPKRPDKHSFTISPRANTHESREHLVTILLKSKKDGKQAYQITFDTSSDKSVAKRFLDVVNVPPSKAVEAVVISTDADSSSKQPSKQTKKV